MLWVAFFEDSFAIPEEPAMIYPAARTAPLGKELVQTILHLGPVRLAAATNALGPRIRGSDFLYLSSPVTDVFRFNTIFFCTVTD